MGTGLFVVEAFWTSDTITKRDLPYGIYVFYLKSPIVIYTHPSGLDGHNGYLIAEKLFVLIALMVSKLGDADMLDVLVNYKIWQETL